MSPLTFAQKLEALLLQGLKAHESLKDKPLLVHRFLDFNKKSVLLELSLSSQETPDRSFKSHIAIQKISGETEDSALNIRIYTPESHTERLALIKAKHDLEREIKIVSGLFEVYFLDYLANAKLANMPALEGTLQSRVDKALAEAKKL